jgi:hypothetical protein
MQNKSGTRKEPLFTHASIRQRAQPANIHLKNRLQKKGPTDRLSSHVRLPTCLLWKTRKKYDTTLLGLLDIFVMVWLIPTWIARLPGDARQHRK